MTSARRVLNPAAAEFVPSSPVAVHGLTPLDDNDDVLKNPWKTKTRRGSHRLVRSAEPREAKAQLDGESASSRESSLVESSDSTKGTLCSVVVAKKTLQQLKVHGPNCDCPRLVRTREKLGGDSGYVVTSRDARLPDVHYGKAYGFVSETIDDRRRRDRETKLAAAIAESDLVYQRISCAACLLDGHWRNGAVCLVGDHAVVASICESANAHGEAKRVIAQGWTVDDVVNDPIPLVASPDGDVGLARCVPVAVAALRRAAAVDDPVLDLPFLYDGKIDERPAKVELKHHIVEALDVVDLDDDHDALCLTYVDHRGILSLDFPGGKRRLAETAWEAAARETADECHFHIADLGDVYSAGQLARLDATDANLAFRVTQTVDGQSVRFFTLRPSKTNLQTDDDDDDRPSRSDDDDDNRDPPDDDDDDDQGPLDDDDDDDPLFAD